MHTKWRSQTCRSGIWFFSFMQCTPIRSTKWVDNNCLHSKLDSIDKWLLHYEIGLPNLSVAEERNLIVLIPGGWACGIHQLCPLSLFFSVWDFRLFCGCAVTFILHVLLLQDMTVCIHQILCVTSNLAASNSVLHKSNSCQSSFPFYLYAIGCEVHIWSHEQQFSVSQNLVLSLKSWSYNNVSGTKQIVHHTCCVIILSSEVMNIIFPLRDW